MTDWQQNTPCPQCASAAAVHSIGELADLARLRLGQLNQAQQGYPPGQQQQGWMATPQTGPLPGPGQGWAQQPQTGPLPGPQSRSAPGYSDGAYADDIGQGVADVALGAAARFLGRKVGQRAQRTYTERVLPAVSAQAEAMLREQIAIAERHPDLRGCFTDNVVFLAGGRRVLPMPNLQGLTVAQSDAIVAQLRQG